MLVEVHVDHNSKQLVVLDSETETVSRAPGAILTNVQVVTDSEGAILVGELIETVGSNFYPRAKSPKFNKARWSRDGRVVDRTTQVPVGSTVAAIAKASGIYYIGE